MSKFIPFALAGAGATVTSVGGVYLIKGTSSAANAQKTTPQPFETLSAFRDNKGDKCVHDLFGADVNMSNLESSVTEISDAAPADGTYFGAQPTSPGNDTKGCLIISWKKTTYGTAPDGGKWRGTFTWSWSFQNQNKGFIIFNVAKTNGANKLALTGATYLLEKETTAGTTKWKIKHKKEVTEAKEITNDNFDAKFPKAKSDLSALRVNNKNHWDFVESKDKLANICAEGSCSGEGQETPYSGRWLWNWTGTTGDKKVGEWGENLDWWEHIYGVAKFNLKTKLDSFTGTWSTASTA